MNRIIQMMISIIFLKITKAEGDGTTWVSPYIIYETGKTYPRPLLVTEADGDVLAFSSPIDGGSDSTTQARMSRYNKAGEYVETVDFVIMKMFVLGNLEIMHIWLLLL